MTLLSVVGSHAQAQFPDNPHEHYEEDPAADVEYWDGVVLPGGPRWEEAPASEQRNWSDLRRIGLAFWNETLWILDGPFVVDNEVKFCRPEQGYNDYWIDFYFTYLGDDYRIEITSTKCDGLQALRTLYRGDERVAELGPYGGATYMNARDIQPGASSWPVGEEMTDAYATILTREQADPCGNSLGSRCGGHWRDRVPDEGTFPSILAIGPTHEPSSDEKPGSQRKTTSWPTLPALLIPFALARRRSKAHAA